MRDYVRCVIISQTLRYIITQFLKNNHASIFIALSLIFVSCSSGATGAARFKKGDCIEQPWGAYIYQVAEVTETTYFLYKVGYMGKEIVKMDFSVVHKDYVTTQCP